MAKGDIKRRREIERLSASLPSMNAEQRKDATECCGTAWIGARVNGARTETIEIDTTEWKIVQCRGKRNHPSKHHRRIVTLMNNNMNRFKEAMAL